MAEQTSLVQEGIDRFRGAYGAIGGEVERVQRELHARRRQVEKQVGKRLDAGRKDLERRAKGIRSELRKSATVKWLEGLGRDAAGQLEGGVQRLLGTFQIASKSDLQRIERRVKKLDRQLKELEAARAKREETQQRTRAPSSGSPAA
jgi:hypothetical protein